MKYPSQMPAESHIQITPKIEGGFGQRFSRRTKTRWGLSTEVLVCIVSRSYPISIFLRRRWADCQTDILTTACLVFEWLRHVHHSCKRYNAWLPPHLLSHNCIAGFLYLSYRIHKRTQCIYLHLSLSLTRTIKHPEYRRGWLHYGRCMRSACGPNAA